MSEPLLAWPASDLEARRILLPKEHVVYVRGILEASDGVAFLLAIKGGDITLVGSSSRRKELDEILTDLRLELGADWLELQPDFEQLRAIA